MSWQHPGRFLSSLLVLAFCATASGEEIKEYSDPGTDSFLVPEGVTSITVEVWGAGGRGGSCPGAFLSSCEGGGGGGGAYARSMLDVSPGETFEVRVGRGSDDAFPGESSRFGRSSNPLVRASGGRSVGTGDDRGASGGPSGQSIGDATYSGGSGADGRGGLGGGGGSSAWQGASGNNGDGRIGGTAGGQGGDGGNGAEGAGRDRNVAGEPGKPPGGGGGGARTRGPTFGRDGGAGGNGLVRVSYESNLQCFSDDFERTSGLGEDWETDVSSGNFEPQVVQEAGQRRLRMTEASGNQATAATLQKLLPADDNLVVLDFNYHAYGARGNGADGLAVVLSDASVTPQAGGFGGSLGYAQRTDQGAGGFAGGWIGIGLDEFGNYSNPSQNEGREGGPGPRPNAVAIRGSGAGLDGYPYIEGASVNPAIDGVGPNASHSYRIIVDSRQSGSAIVKVFRDEDGGRDYGDPILNVDVLAANDDQADVPENFLLSFTGSTGASVNTHEISEIELCAQELEDIGEQVEYFEIKHDGQALTCTPADVSIRACMNDDCSERYPGKVKVEMAPSGWIGGDVFSFEPSDTDDEGFFNTQLQVTEAGLQDLRVVSSDPRRTAYSEDQCIGPNGGRSLAPCELQFLDASLQFEVPKQTAHKPSDPIQIQALRQSDNDPMRCVPAFSDKERPVEFSFDYVEPDPRAASRPVILETARDQASIAQGESEILTLDFNEKGAADFTLTYDDAGKMLLNALFQGEPDTPEEGLQLTGESGWVSVPEGLCVEADSVCDEGNEDCPVFGVAGEPFDLTMRAVGYSDSTSHLCDGNPATPNFELANISLEHELKEPSSGIEGDLGETAYDHRIDGNGETISQQRVSEVGVFSFSADPGSGTYFGETVPGGTSKPIGRFRPAEFAVAPENGELMPPCSAAEPFAYIGQKIAIDSTAPANFEITALNAQEKTTQNYTFPGFQYLSDDDLSGPGQVEYGGEPYSPNTDGVNRELTSPDEASGVMNYKIMGDVVYEKSAGSRPDPSKPEFAVDLSSFNDGDGVSSSFDDMNKPQALAVAVPEFKVRYGRIRLDNVYGPENLNLTLPLRAEYWKGGRFRLNTADGCFQYNPWSESEGGDVRIISSDVAENPRTENPDNFPAVQEYELETGEPKEGNEILVRSASDPVDPDDPSSEVELLNVPDWLKPIDSDGNLQNPSATATFGVYRGHDRIIYWREVE